MLADPAVLAPEPPAVQRVRAGQVDVTDDDADPTERTDRDDMPLGLHDPRAEAQRTEAMIDPSSAGGVHEAAGQRAAVSGAVACDKTR